MASTCLEVDCVEGACCYSSGSCDEQIGPYCEENGGVYLGAETTCSEFNCSNLESACCFDYECQYLTEDDCESQGGYLYGYNYSCDEVDCGPPGGCCFETSCEEMVELECLEQGGFFQGSGTPCDDWWTCPVVSCCTGLSTLLLGLHTRVLPVSIGGDPGDSSCGDWDPCVDSRSLLPSMAMVTAGTGPSRMNANQSGAIGCPIGECEWAPCMRGNCCVEGECMQLFYEDCMAWGGEYTSPIFEWMR